MVGRGLLIHWKIKLFVFYHNKLLCFNQYFIMYWKHAWIGHQTENGLSPHRGYLLVITFYQHLTSEGFSFDILYNSLGLSINASDDTLPLHLIMHLLTQIHSTLNSLHLTWEGSRLITFILDNTLFLSLSLWVTQRQYARGQQSLNTSDERNTSLLLMD